MEQTFENLCLVAHALAVAIAVPQNPEDLGGRGDMVINAPVLVDVDGNELLERNDGVAQHGCLDLHACHMRRRMHAFHMRRRIHACHERRRIHAFHRRRRIHVWHMRRRIQCMPHEEEDTMHVI
jgi:hypothetical protein